MKTIYFVRHGECQANVERVMAGSQNDSPLTALGMQQADDTGDVLKGKQIDLILVSPLIRAQDTAKRIAAKIGYEGEIRTEPLLVERDFGSVTGVSMETALPALDAGTVIDVESLEDLGERMQHVLDLFADLPQQFVLVVGHGGAERMLRTIYEGRTPDTFLQTEGIHNAVIREYVID